MQRRAGRVRVGTMLLCASLLVARAAGEAGGAAADVESERAAVRQELMAQLEGLAAWCAKQKVFLKRQEVYEWMLRLDPENADARRGLGWIKDKDGQWRPKEHRVPPVDHDKEAASEFALRRAEVAAGFAGALFALLDGHADELSAEERESLLDDVLRVDPDNARAHDLRGEAKLADRWVLVETVAAKQRRGELREMVRTAFRTVPKARARTPDAKERGFGIEWTAVYTSPLVRSLGTGSEEEVRRLTEAMWATRSYFNAALGAGADFPEDFTVYSLARSSDKLAFLTNHPSIGPEYREFLLRCDGSGIQGSGDLAHWAPDELRRLDGLVRQAITWLFAEGFGILPGQGWAVEGFGLYLTRELVGTRLSWFVRPSEYLNQEDDLALQARLLDSRTNWMNEAHRVLNGKGRPRLAFLLGKDVNRLTAEDLLYSYVLAAYLLEAESTRLPDLLARIGAGTPAVEAFEAVFGEPPEELGAHVRRWLGERY